MNISNAFGSDLRLFRPFPSDFTERILRKSSAGEIILSAAGCNLLLIIQARLAFLGPSTTNKRLRNDSQNFLESAKNLVL